MGIQNINNPGSVTSFIDWFEHNFQANVSLLGVISEMQAPSEKLVSVAGHLIQAHLIWLDRIDNTGSTADPWKALALEEMTRLNDLLKERTLKMLTSNPFPELMVRQVVYKNSKGVEYRNSVAEILYHILAHSSYHRGQLALLLRLEGVAPPTTDYIFSKRKA